MRHAPFAGGHASRELHCRLVNGDQTVLTVIADNVLPTIRRRLRRAFRSASQGSIEDATEDAFVQYALGPVEFDASRGVPLEYYLYQAAARNVIDLLRAEDNRRAREAAYASWLSLRASAALARERDQHLRVSLAATIRNFGAGEAERKAFSLWIEGKGGTEPLAIALGLNHLPIAAQRQEVKRFKDRVLKRLARSRPDVERFPRRAHVPSSQKHHS
jgi:hypothetical protein